MAKATASRDETHAHLGGSGSQTLTLVGPYAGRAAAPCEQPLLARCSLAEIAAEAAGRAPGVASLAESERGRGAAAGRSPGVVAIPSLDGHRQDLRVSVRAYLGDFLELGWAVRDAIRRAAAAHGLEREVGLIDVEVVALVLPIEEMPAA